MKNRQGSTLVLVLMILVVLSILATGTMGIMMSENKQSIYQKDKIQAYYIARSGAEATEAAIKKIIKDDNKIINDIRIKQEEMKTTQDNKVISKLESEIENLKLKLINIHKFEWDKNIKVDIDGIDFNNGGIIDDIKIRKEGDLYIIVSRSKVNKSFEIVEKVINVSHSDESNDKQEIGTKTEIDKAISANQNIILGDSGSIAGIGGNIKSNGKIQISTNGSSPLITGNILIVNENDLLVSGDSDNNEKKWSYNNKLKIKEDKKEFSYASPIFPLLSIKQPPVIKNTNVKDNIDLKMNGDLKEDIYTSSGDITISGSGNLVGDICTSSGNIVIEGNGKIDGDIYTGNGNIKIKGSRKVKGNIYTTSGNLYIDGAQDLEINIYSGNGNIDLNGGGYIIGEINTISGSINIPGDKKIKGKISSHKGNINIGGSGSVEGDILIKDGNINLSGSGRIVKGSIYVNNGDVKFLGSSSLNGNIISSSYQDIKLDGGGTVINGIIYAPRSDVLFNNSAKVYGAVIGNRIIFKNWAATVRYTESNINTDNIKTDKIRNEIDSYNIIKGSYYRQRND